MHEFTNAIRTAVESQNWFAALFLAFCMPDICATIENPNNNDVGGRYKKWFTENLGAIYSSMFSADDCYYFRCSCLHQGLDTHAKLTYEKIHFITPPPKDNIVHKNKINNILQMQIDIFCNDVADAVDLWYESVVKNDSDMQLRVNSLIKIYGPESLKPFISFE